MKASRFSDAQKAFILKQGSDGVQVERATQDLCSLLSPFIRFEINLRLAIPAAVRTRSVVVNVVVA
jgi:hypothetical protein